MTNEITKYRTGSVAVRKLIESDAYQSRLKALLGERAPQFCASVIQISQLTNLANCEPESIIAAAMIAATLDLPINPNLAFAYIVPYGTQAQMQIGYKGYVQLAARSGQYKRLNVTMVYEGELLRHDRAKAEVIIDESKRKSDKITGYVAFLELNSGFEHAEYWDVETVKKHAERFSQAYKKKKMDSPWFQNFDQMAMKTVLKSLLSHWGPLSVQMQTAVTLDQSSRAHLDADPEFIDTTSAVVEEAPNMPEKPKRGRKPAEAEPISPVSDAASEQPKEAEKASSPQEPSVAQQLLDAGVIFDDFTDYLVNQNIMRNAKDFPDYDSVPKVIYEFLGENDRLIVNKIIKIYGKPA